MVRRMPDQYLKHLVYQSLNMIDDDIPEVDTYELAKDKTVKNEIMKELKALRKSIPESSVRLDKMIRIYQSMRNLAIQKGMDPEISSAI